MIGNDVRRLALCILTLFIMLGCSSRIDREFVLAASEGNVPRVRALLEQGADVNFRLPDNGTTALIAAARNGHLPVVEVLLTAGANINEVDHDVGSALYWAAFNGQVGMMKFLIGKGAKLNCSSAAANYLLRIIRDKGFSEAEPLTQTQLRNEGITIHPL